MDAPKMEVKCGVDTCRYYKNNVCHASKLEVKPMNYNAKTSTDTCCQTFQPQSS